jgi:hypothetical protein
LYALLSIAKLTLCLIAAINNTSSGVILPLVLAKGVKARKFGTVTLRYNSEPGNYL